MQEEDKDRDDDPLADLNGPKIVDLKVSGTLTTMAKLEALAEHRKTSKSSPRPTANETQTHTKMRECIT